jgi:hypothetical protein
MSRTRFGLLLAVLLLLSPLVVAAAPLLRSLRIAIDDTTVFRRYYYELDNDEQAEFRQQLQAVLDSTQFSNGNQKLREFARLGEVYKNAQNGRCSPLDSDANGQYNLTDQLFWTQADITVSTLDFLTQLAAKLASRELSGHPTELSAELQEFYDGYRGWNENNPGHFDRRVPNRNEVTTLVTSLYWDESLLLSAYLIEKSADLTRGEVLLSLPLPDATKSDQLLKLAGGMAHHLYYVAEQIRQGRDESQLSPEERARIQAAKAEAKWLSNGMEMLLTGRYLDLLLSSSAEGDEKGAGFLAEIQREADINQFLRLFAGDAGVQGRNLGEKWYQAGGFFSATSAYLDVLQHHFESLDKDYQQLKTQLLLRARNALAKQEKYKKESFIASDDPSQLEEGMFHTTTSYVEYNEKKPQEVLVKVVRGLVIDEKSGDHQRIGGAWQDAIADHIDYGRTLNHLLFSVAKVHQAIDAVETAGEELTVLQKDYQALSGYLKNQSQTVSLALSLEASQSAFVAQQRDFLAGKFDHNDADATSANQAWSAIRGAAPRWPGNNVMNSRLIDHWISIPQGAPAVRLQAARYVDDRYAADLCFFQPKDSGSGYERLMAIFLHDLQPRIEAFEKAVLLRYKEQVKTANLSSSTQQDIQMSISGKPGEFLFGEADHSLTPIAKDGGDEQIVVPAPLIFHPDAGKTGIYVNDPAQIPGGLKSYYQQIGLQLSDAEFAFMRRSQDFQANCDEFGASTTCIIIGSIVNAAADFIPKPPELKMTRALIQVATDPSSPYWLGVTAKDAPPAPTKK